MSTPRGFWYNYLGYFRNLADKSILNHLTIEPVAEMAFIVILNAVKDIIML